MVLSAHACKAKQLMLKATDSLMSILLYISLQLDLLFRMPRLFKRDKFYDES